ncbi:hypothetical protein KW797_00090 [Candidatus Parcubacteria bacterium]|nr:hypothetical protein [Candidatus Parcubacteria bacterium]
MVLDLQFSPDLGELSEEDANRLGELVEHPSWPLFEKYLAIERWATLNNGIITAKGEQEYGYCQGDIGRINKIESDMRIYHAQFQSDRQLNQMKRDDHDVTNRMIAEYTDDPDLPLAP